MGFSLVLEFSMFLLQTNSAKILWSIVVCLGFIGSGILIGKSYTEWQESPISTAITTHPIDDLDFPVVTVCPPKDSNTALYHDLVKAGNGSLSDHQKDELKKAAFDIFMKMPHEDYEKKTFATPKSKDLKQVYQGFFSLPMTYDGGNGFEIKMWNKNGSITTPWYKEDFFEEYYKENKDFHMALELPVDIKEQIGSGSLVIDLEIDTREEKNWSEQVYFATSHESVSPSKDYVYTFHTTPKNWTEAEAYCQNAGGHLASITSEEVNDEMKTVTRTELGGWAAVWVGGRKGSRRWSWSSNSTWGFTDWHRKAEGNHTCLLLQELSEGKWLEEACSKQHDFVCQSKLLRGTKTLKIEFTNEQLIFSSFHVWYQYKAVGRQLLSSWEEKRMTGLRFSWRIENPPMTTTTNELGRSIQTPGLGSTFDSHADASLDQVYKASLEITNGLQVKIGNGTLVISLNVDTRQGDKVEYTVTRYQLHKVKKSWDEANAHCKSEGGELATIHSEFEQTLAKRAAEGNYAWLGARRASDDVPWRWSDNSVWSFDNWKRILGPHLSCLRMDPVGLWSGYSHCGSGRYFLCQLKNLTTLKKGLTTVEFKKEHLTFSKFDVLFKSKAIGTEIHNTSEPLTEMTRRGFTLDWFLEDDTGRSLTEKLPSKPEDWLDNVHVQTPRYIREQPFLVKMVRIAQQLRMQNMTSEQIITKIIKDKVEGINRRGFSFMEGICSKELKQVNPSDLRYAFSELVSAVDKNEAEEPATDLDFETGIKIFHVMVFCPLEVIKIFQFYDNLLSTQSARTIIQTSVNTFKTGAITDKKSHVLAKEFYAVLASSLNLQYGNVLLATSTKSQLQEVLNKDWPFFTNNTASLTTCLKDSDCESIQDMFEIKGILTLIESHTV